MVKLPSLLALSVQVSTARIWAPALTIDTTRLDGAAGGPAVMVTLVE